MTTTFGEFDGLASADQKLINDVADELEMRLRADPATDYVAWLHRFTLEPLLFRHAFFTMLLERELEVQGAQMGALASYVERTPPEYRHLVPAVYHRVHIRHSDGRPTAV